MWEFECERWTHLSTDDIWILLMPYPRQGGVGIRPNLGTKVLGTSHFHMALWAHEIKLARNNIKPLVYFKRNVWKPRGPGNCCRKPPRSRVFVLKSPTRPVCDKTWQDHKEGPKLYQIRWNQVTWRHQNGSSHLEVMMLSGEKVSAKMVKLKKQSDSRMVMFRLLYFST